MTSLFTNVRKSLRHTGAIAAITVIGLTVTASPSSVADETTPTGSTVSQTVAKASPASGQAKSTQTAPDDKSTALPLLDEKGVPYLETAQTAPGISEQLAKQLAAAGDIKAVFIDDTRNVAVIVTTSGVVGATSYNQGPELLQALFDAEILPTFVSFAPAPVTEIRRIEKEKERFDWVTVGKMLPFLIMIGGTCVIYDMRQRKLRKLKGTVAEGHTAYQTREGTTGTIPTVTFDDVAGCEEAMEDLSEIVEFLKNPEKFERLGAKIPRGALLVGPPGTGKTLLARAVAGEAKVSFFAASGSDFVEMYVGVGPARVRELFTKARAAEKAIVFIDEIDAVARSRAMSTKQNANDERENTLNALLHELDGFDRSNVILLAATNRVDILDPAIIRPGRLDRKIQVPNPDRRGREKILAVHVAGKPLAKDVDLGEIARRKPGMSGADLAQIANEAAIEAARRNQKSINAACFSAAVALVAMGRARRSALVTNRDRLITAYHEAGHTVCALAHPEAANPAGVSITPRGHAGGITWMTGTDDQYLARPSATAQLVVALGGRAGEELLLDGEFTQGPSSDLERATQLATVMVTKYGMTRRGLSVRSGEPDAASHDIIEEMLSTALDDARALLDKHSALFHAIVNQLLEHDTLEAADIEDIVAALDPETHPGFGENSVRVLHHAGQVVHDAVEAAGNAVLQVGRTVRRPVTKNNDKTTDKPAAATKQASAAKSTSVKAVRKRKDVKPGEPGNDKRAGKKKPGPEIA